MLNQEKLVDKRVLNESNEDKSKEAQYTIWLKTDQNEKT